MRSAYLVGILFLFCSAELVAQPITRHSVDKTSSLAVRFASDATYLAASPVRLADNQPIKLVGLGALTAGLMLGIDKPVYRGFNNESPFSLNYDETQVFTAPGRLYDRIGPDLFTFGSSGLMTGIGYLTRNDKLLNTGVTALEAVFFTKLTTGVLKSAFGRGRPFTGEGQLDFSPGNFSGGNPVRSFPSGHTSRIFAFATVMSTSYDSPFIKIPAFGLAGSVALQRIESNRHWFSDVFVGGAIGYFIGKAIAQRNGLAQKRPGINPIVKGGRLGINIQF